MELLFNKTAVILEISGPEPWLTTGGQTKGRWLHSASAGGMFPWRTAPLSSFQLSSPVICTCQSQRVDVCGSRRQLGHSKESLSWGWTLCLGNWHEWSSRNLVHRWKTGSLWKNISMAWPLFSMGFLSCPGNHAVWLPLHDKQPRPSPCGEGHCVPAKLEGGVGDEGIQLQLRMSAEMNVKTPSTSAVEDCTCSLWFHSEIPGQAKHAQGCSQVLSVWNLKIHIQNFTSNFWFNFSSLFFPHRFTCGLFVPFLSMLKLQHHSRLFCLCYWELPQWSV